MSTEPVLPADSVAPKIGDEITFRYRGKTTTGVVHSRRFDSPQGGPWFIPVWIKGDRKRGYYVPEVDIVQRNDGAA